MRLKNKPWANQLIDDHPEAALDRPDPEVKIDWDSRFAKKQPIEIEIGSGKGQFITTLAQQHPEKNFIAMEIQKTAAGIILKKKLDEGLDNLQILCADAANLVDYFGQNSTNRIYLNFSDPWPKTRHEKRRLTYRSFLEEYRQVLTADGMIEFKTDNAGLFAYSLKSMNNFGMHFDFVSVDLHHEKEEIVAANIETEYEHKFASKGNPIYCLHADFLDKDR